MTPRRLRILTVFSMMFAILMPHLSELNYGFISLEKWMFLLAIVLIAASLGAICSNKFAFAFVVGFLGFLLLDVYVIDITWAAYAFTGTVAVAMLAIPRLPQGLPLAIVVFGFVFGGPSFFAQTRPYSTVVAGPEIDADSSRSLPAYLHIILDEQMSTGPAGAAEFDSPVRQELNSFYTDRGFHMYAQAVSNSAETYEALGGVFGLTTSPDNYHEYPVGSRYRYRVEQTALVDRLAAMGFDTTVIETTYLRLCGTEGQVNCETYQTAYDMQIMSDVGLNPLERFQIALFALHDSYIRGKRQIVIYQAAAVWLSKLTDTHVRVFSYASRPLVDVRILEDVAGRVASIEPGQAIIAHLLVPHTPYVLDPECQLRDPDQWQYSLRGRPGQDLADAVEGIWDQSACAHSKLDQILSAAEGNKNLVVAIHGDHGGRLVFGTDQENDFDSLTTILAVRGPNVASGLTTSPVDLQQTFIDFFEASMSR